MAVLVLRLATDELMKSVGLYGQPMTDAQCVIATPYRALYGVIATWNLMPSLGPRWYPIALVVTALPCACATILERTR